MLPKKIINSGVAKNVLNSSVGKTIADNITKENFKKAADSVIGRQLKKAVVSKIDDTFDKAVISGLQKISLPKTGIKRKISPNQLPPGKATFGRKKGKKRRKIGKGIIWE